MKPQNKIKKAIMLQRASWDKDFILPDLDTEEQIESFWEQQEGEDEWKFQDDKEEFRGGQVETKIKCEFSRHYESKSVASKLQDGSWVGWTYWYGGGKHGEPSAIEWMEDAYDLDCKEHQEMVTIREFTKLEPSNVST